MGLDVWHPCNYFEQTEMRQSARDHNDIIISNKTVFH